MLAAHVGISHVDEMMTSRGHVIDEYIRAASDSLNLTDVIGCSKFDYTLTMPSENNSMFGLWLYDVVPKMMLIKNETENTRVFIGNAGGIRDGIYKGVVTINDIFSIAPFLDGYNRVDNISRSDFLKLRNILDHGTYMSSLLSLIDVYRRDVDMLRGVVDGMPKWNYNFHAMPDDDYFDIYFGHYDSGMYYIFIVNFRANYAIY